MKKKDIIISLIVITVIVILFINNVGNNYLKFNSEGVLLEHTITPVYGEIDEMYDRTTKIYNNGKVEIIHDNQIIDTFTIDEIYIRSLQREIARVNFMQLDGDVSTISTDGAYHSITVNTKTETHISKGLNPSNKRFCTLESTVRDIILKHQDNG